MKMSSSGLVRSVDFTSFYLLFVGVRVTPPLYCAHLFPRIRASPHQYIFCLSAAYFVKIIQHFCHFCSFVRLHLQKFITVISWQSEVSKVNNLQLLEQQNEKQLDLFDHPFIRNDFKQKDCGFICESVNPWNSNKSKFVCIKNRIINKF